MIETLTREAPQQGRPPDSPYVGLRPFPEAKARFFFGRGREIDILTANLRASRLTLVYGPSGVGKSSLLQAGVVPHVRNLLDLTAPSTQGGRALPDGRVRFAVSVVNRWTDDPLRTLMRRVGASVEEATGQPGVGKWDPSISALDFALSWTRRVRALLVVLDQFEEYFQYHGGETGRGTFATEWPHLVNDPQLRMNFLVSIREDSWSRFDVFKEKIPHLYGNYLRIDHLDRRSAADAIRGPIEELNRALDPVSQRFSIDDQLVGGVLEEVPVGRLALVQSVGVAGSEGTPSGSGERFEAPFLQLVMDRLWRETVALGGSELSLETLTRLGGAEEIVRSHLVESLAELTKAEQDTAASVLRYLVSRSNTKVAHRASDLAEWAERPVDEVRDVLEKLTREEGGRLLRPVAALAGEDSAPRYEIRHDLLGEAIVDWIQSLKQERETEALVARVEQERDEARRHEKAKQREFRNRIVRWSALLLAFLVAALAATSLFALSQERKVRRLVTIQRSQALAASANAQLPVDPELSVAIASVAVQTADTPSSEAALRVALGASRVRATFKAAAFPTEPWNVVAMDPSGTLLAAGSSGGDVVVWDVATHEEVANLAAKGSIGWVEFSPDGKSLLVLGRSTKRRLYHGPARVWTIKSESEPRELRDPWTPNQLFPSAHFSKDGHIVTGSHMGAAVWDATGSKPLEVLPFLAGSHGRSLVNSVAFDSSGQLVAAGGADGTVKVWKWQTDQLPLELHLPGTPGKDAGVIGVAFSPVGHLVLATGPTGETRVWDFDTGRLESTLQPSWHQGGAASFSPDGSYVLTWGDKSADVWDARSGQLVSQLVGHTDSVNAATFSPFGEMVATGSGDGTARLWDTATGHEFISLAGHHGGVNAVLFDGPRLVTASDDATVRTWDLDPPRFDLRGHDDWVLSAAFSPIDGNQVATASSDGTARLWNLQGESSQPLYASSLLLDSVSFSPDGRWILVGGADGKGGTISVFDARESSLPRLSEWHMGNAGDEVIDAEFAPDATKIVTAAASGEAYIWDWDGHTASSPCVLDKRRNVVTSATFTPDGRYVLTTGWSGGARVLAVDDCQSQPANSELDINPAPRVRTFGARLGALWTASFSPDPKQGDLVVTAGGDDTARIWDWKTGALVRTLVGHTSWVSSAAFSPSGTQIVTGSADQTTRVWDTATGAVLAVIHEHADSINDVTFSPDGRWILSASDDRTAKVYACETCGPLSELLRVAVQRVTRPLTPDERREFLS